MNTGADNYDEMRWVLRAIKKEQSLTPAGENVKIDIDQLTKRDPDAPALDTVRKCIRLLDSQSAFRVENKKSKNVAYSFEPVDSDWDWATSFELAINQKKFDETCRIYESSDSYENHNKGKSSAAAPRTKPIIREKTLELIAKKIGDLDSMDGLEKFLKSCGVKDAELIFHSDTKWRMVFEVMVYLSDSAKKEDVETLSKIIGEATHPLRHDGDERAAYALRLKFNQLLKYDNMGIAYDGADGTYRALRNAGEDEAQIEADDYFRSLEEENEKQLAFLRQPENSERVSLLRKAYQSLMNVVALFCENSSYPTVELNNDFLFLYRLINTTISDIELSQAQGGPFSRNEHFFYLPFTSLFSAENYYKERGEAVDWETLRPAMYAMYGDIEELYQEVNGSDILAEPNKQKKLNDIQLHLSTLKKKREVAQKMVAHKMDRSTPTTKIEITSLPELRIKSSGEIAKSAERKDALNGGNKKPEQINIKSVHLDGQLLIINTGQTTISFNSNKSGERGEGAEASKTFKVFNLLWGDRYETKDRAITNKSGKMTSAANLKRIGGISTKGALDKLIDRLNARFAEQGLKIKIDGKAGMYKLSVNFE